MSGWRDLLVRRGPWLALALSVVLCLPAPTGGLFSDDYVHQLIFEMPKGSIGGSAPWNFFTFTDGNPAITQPLIAHGPLMWLTWPKLRMRFMRPLSSLLIFLDHEVFGKGLAGPHLHSVLWYLALVAVACLLFRRTLGPAGGLLAPVAMLLFAGDDTHWLAALWLANRNSLVATAPVLLGLVAHLRWREDGWRPGLWLSLPCYATGLAGGEAALGALAYLLAYELLAGPGGWKKRLLALAPVGLLGLGYLAIYKAWNGGASGSGIYIDPLVSPLSFLAHAPARALALLGAQFLASPVDAWLLAEKSHLALVAVGVLAVLLVGAMLRATWPSIPEPTKRHLRWLLAGSGLSLVPVLATFPLARLLLMPGLGAAAAVSALLLYAPRRGWLRFGVVVLFITNVALAPVGWLTSYLIGRVVVHAHEKMAFETGFTDDELTRRVLLFAAPDAMIGLYAPMVRMWKGLAPPRAWLCFSLAPYPHRLTRVSADTLELEVEGGHMGETVFEQITRSHDIGYQQGERVELDGATVTVIALEEGLPKRLRIQLTEPLDGDAYALAQWKGGRLDRLELPAVGQSVELPLTPGALAF